MSKFSIPIRIVRPKKIKKAEFANEQFQRKANLKKIVKTEVSKLEFHKILQVLLRFFQNRL
jgi:hypothetical protein